MKFLLPFLGLCALFSSTLALSAAPAWFGPSEAEIKTALLSAPWDYEDVPPNPWKKAWTRLQFNPDGTATCYHDATKVKTVPWQITGPKTVKIEDFWYYLDDGLTTFEFWPPTGSVLKKGTRQGAVVATAKPPEPKPGATPAPPAAALSIDLLRKEGPNIVNWTLAPLDVALPEGFRENVVQLRESLLDDAAKVPAANPTACQAGVRFCDALLAAMTERETNVSQAQASAAVGTSSALGARRRDLNTDRKHLPVLYNSNWPVYRRELNDEKARQANLGRVDGFFNEARKLQWNDRANQLRKNAETLYEQFRVAARHPVAMQ